MSTPFGMLLIAAAIAFALTPVARLVAVRFGIVCEPCSRSVHTEPKPYLGGLAIYGAFALTVLYAVGVRNPEIVGLLVGGAAITLLGVIDDKSELPSKVKLLGTIVVAWIPTAFGLTIDYISNPFDPGTYIQFGVWAVPITIIWIVSVIHVVNVVDGLDGLAAGISSIAALVLLFVSLQTGQAAIAVPLTAALAGSALGFLPHNFNPAKIFMGDAGSMFLGFALAGVSVHGVLKSTTAIALAVPVLALGIPILDSAFAIVRRVGNGRRWDEADRDHLHHRLLALGLSQKEAVFVMYGVSGWLGLSAIAILQMSLIQAAGVLAFVAVSFYFVAKKVGILSIRPAEGRNFHLKS